MSREWSNGLCDCFTDCATCIIAYFCPCYVFGKNAEQVGDSCCLCGFASLLGCIGLYARTHIRGKIRDQKGIEGTCCKDCLTICFCNLCALVQETYELKPPGGNTMARE